MEEITVKKLVFLLLMVLLLSSLSSYTVYASGGQSGRSCPQGYELHPLMDPMDQMHTHIGLDQDLNGNGFVCMKMVTPDYCVIVDDTIPG
jgi:hypothetical protein